MRRRRIEYIYCVTCERHTRKFSFGLPICWDCWCDLDRMGAMLDAVYNHLVKYKGFDYAFRKPIPNPSYQPSADIERFLDRLRSQHKPRLFE